MVVDKEVPGTYREYQEVLRLTAFRWVGRWGGGCTLMRTIPCDLIIVLGISAADRLTGLLGARGTRTRRNLMLMIGHFYSFFSDIRIM